MKKFILAFATVSLTGLITAACEEALEGKYDDSFLVDVFQAGSGTSSNMNVNEVLANAAAIVLYEAVRQVGL